MDPVDGDQVYAAEQLLKTRKRAGKTEYFVKWKGWGAKYNTWEPADNILDPRLIEDFEKRHPPRVATKRASEGTAPTTPVPKRGRISNRGAAKEETPESSSASTSASARAARNSRRSRRGESAASDVTTEEKIDEEPATETTEEADKKKEEAKVAADGKAEPEPEEKEEAKEEEDEKKAENEQPTKEVSEETQEEEKEKDEQPEQQEEAKDEELSMKLDESSTSAQETAAAAPDAPLEIYVEKTVNGERSEASEAAPAPVNGDASASGNGTEAFVITKEDDPACTHKIQVFRAPTEGTAAETSRDDSSDVEFVETIEKKETVIETRRWTDRVDGAVSSSSSSDQYQYVGARTVTDVTANDTTVTILEI